MTTKAKPDMILWLADNRGVYIPQHFAGSFVDRDKHVRGVDAETWEILESGPNHDGYWDAWTEVCDDAIVTDEHGNEFSVYQDGDCWLVPVGMEWNDDKGTFVWPEEESETAGADADVDVDVEA